MYDRTRWLALAAQAGGWLVTGGGPTATARPIVQAQVRPNGYNPYMFRPGFTTPFPYYGYSSFPYWGPGYNSGPQVVENPGVDAGDLIRAYGVLMITYQQARSMRIDVRRKQLEQWMWERDNLPNSEDERERFRRLEVQRARLNPPPPEIWSGHALNQLLTDLQLTFSLASEGESMPIPADLLPKITVTSGEAGGAGSVFKDRRLAWPILFTDPVFAEPKSRADELVARAYQEAAQGQLTLETVGGLRRCYQE